jgi:hypothetical protein
MSKAHARKPEAANRKGARVPNQLSFLRKSNGLKKIPHHDRKTAETFIEGRQTTLD